MSRIMKDCTKGVLYTPDGGKWPARVENVDDSLTLYLDKYSGYGTQYGTRVDFYDDTMGIIQTECEVMIHRNTDHPEAPEKWVGSCMIVKVVKITQRHLDVRVDVDIHTVFESNILGSFGGTITNLSAGGLLLLADREIPDESILSFSYAFRTLERPFMIRVIHRRKKTADGILYGCAFVNLSDRAEAAIRSYVFRKMRDNAHAEEDRQLAELRKRNEEERQARMAAQRAEAERQLRAAGNGTRDSGISGNGARDSGVSGNGVQDSGISGNEPGSRERQERADAVRERQNASTGVSVNGIQKI